MTLDARPAAAEGGGRPLRLRLLWVAYGLSGAATLADEVVWTRFLQLVLGSSVYAVAAMLSALMAGLAVGGWLGARRGDRIARPARAIALCEVGVAATALLSLPLLRLVQELHLVTYARFQLHPGLYFAIDALVAAPAVVLPTVLMGFTFPLVARLAVEADGGRVAEAVGGAYAANTVGAIAGSALAGFVLVPAAGLWGALLASAAANVAAAALVLAAARAPVRALGAVAALAVLAPIAWWAQPSAVPLGYHLAGRMSADPDLRPRLQSMRVVYDNWPPQGRVQVLEDPTRTRVLVVDGRIEGASRGSERTTQDFLALAPGALRGTLSRVFAIGLGTGRTLTVALETYRGAEVTAAEVNPAVVEAVLRHFRKDLGRWIVAGEGRAELARRPPGLDAIISSPSFPVDGTSGSLFTAEFFALARARLASEGILVAWVPGYLLDADELRALVATAARSFPHLALWKVRASGDLVLLASGEPFEDRVLPGRLAELDEPYWAMANVIEPVFHADEVAEVLGGVPRRLNSDVDPWLELAMARNLVRGPGWLDR